ncbi:dihydropteroate synthase [Boudabousia liubingyangii]|nr:dihydropteroate synthase [Boudabousia liubingyangii]
MPYSALLDPAPTRVMGILNVTPDSFSDGGRYQDVDDAVARGLEMIKQGAAIIDIGGESTRPASDRISPQAEQLRIMHVVRALVEEGVTVSVDTLHAATARAAAEAGAAIINDVSGGCYDPDMAKTIADLDCLYVCQHWRTTPDLMDQAANYEDALSEVCRELLVQLQDLENAGVELDRVIVDPGLGFAKRSPHNWAMMAGVDTLASLGCPVLVGASRKRFLGDLVDGEHQATDRDTLTAVVSGFLALKGVWGTRVHDVVGSVQAIRAAQELLAAQSKETTR